MAEKSQPSTWVTKQSVSPTQPEFKPKIASPKTSAQITDLMAAFTAPAGAQWKTYSKKVKAEQITVETPPDPFATTGSVDPNKMHITEMLLALQTLYCDKTQQKKVKYFGPNPLEEALNKALLGLDQLGTPQIEQLSLARYGEKEHRILTHVYAEPKADINMTCLTLAAQIRSDFAVEIAAFKKTDSRLR